MCETWFTSASSTLNIHQTHSCAILSLSETPFFSSFFKCRKQIFWLVCAARVMGWITCVLRRLHGQVQVGLAGKTEWRILQCLLLGGAPPLWSPPAKVDTSATKYVQGLCFRTELHRTVMPSWKYGLKKKQFHNQQMLQTHPPLSKTHTI